VIELMDRKENKRARKEEKKSVEGFKKAMEENINMPNVR
jgi:hypothetical protein